MSGENTSGYLQEIKGGLDGPACTVCGAIMVPVNNTADGKYKHWACLSCGAETRPS